MSDSGARVGTSIIYIKQLDQTGWMEIINKRENSFKVWGCIQLKCRQGRSIVVVGDVKHTLHTW